MLDSANKIKRYQSTAIFTYKFLIFNRKQPHSLHNPPQQIRQISFPEHDKNDNGNNLMAVPKPKIGRFRKNHTLAA